MELEEAISTRYSCRDYSARAVEPEVIRRIFDTARLAPSAKNLQDWRFVVVTAAKLKSLIAATTNRAEIFQKAGAIIVACTTSELILSCGQPAGPIDVSIMLDHISLIATDLGLATCWIGSFDVERVRELAGIPSHVQVVELMALGYPADKPVHRPRLPVDDILSFDKWGFQAP